MKPPRSRPACTDTNQAQIAIREDIGVIAFQGAGCGGQDLNLRPSGHESDNTLRDPKANRLVTPDSGLNGKVTPIIGTEF